MGTRNIRGNALQSMILEPQCCTSEANTILNVNCDEKLNKKYIQKNWPVEGRGKHVYVWCILYEMNQVCH